MNLQKRIVTLLIGYVIGLVCFFLFDMLWGDLPLKAFTDIARWLPITMAYLVVILLLSFFTQKWNSSRLMIINGFFVVMLSILEARPPNQDSWSDGAAIILQTAIALFVINLIAIILGRRAVGKSSQTATKF
jgi:hypothetical protein